MLNTGLVTAKPVLASWAQATGSSPLQQMMSVANRSDVISLSLGLPAAEFFPAAEMGAALQSVLRREPFALQYSFPSQALKTHIVKLMEQRGVRCREEQIFLTAGAQQGISLLTRLLLNQGGEVLCEEIVYTGFQQAIEPFQPLISTVSTDPDSGIDVEAVERTLLQTQPAFIYVIADGQNPMGVSMSPEKRRRLAELANAYGVPIVEDDAYGFIYYKKGRCEPPLRAFNDSWVFYIGTFSKILAPALRTGWIVAPEELIPKLAIIKEATDINTCTLNQRAISAYLDEADLPARIEKLQRVYRERRDAMLEALVKHFPPGSCWREPSSGFFVWVELPEPVDMRVLVKTAIETEGVGFIPGQAFAVKQTSARSTSMRLNFSNNDPAKLNEAIARLSRAVERTLLCPKSGISSAQRQRRGI
ncbi:MAG TPA: PLP-dependent aminotransferase family protein [Pyrinomonadaceae bacterium]|nr:PLP-dependent aminotransferase family protein [Pyrinomonadaceae bacterium]